MIARSAVACAVLGVVALGAACTSPAPPAPEPTVPAFESSSVATSGPPPSTGPRLAQECSGVLSVQTIDVALGRPLVGRVRSIVGVPEPNINRTERLTCQYGLPEPPPPPGQASPVPMEVSISVYGDEASAQERVAATIDSERGRGATPSTVQVGPADGTLLVTADTRLLVAVDGPITLAISVAPGVADDRIEEVLADIGGQVLEALAR